MISQLAQGIAASPILDTLIMWGNNISTVMNLLGPAMAKLNYFEIVEGSLTDTSLIDLSPFLRGSLLQTLYLNFNLIGDDGVLALANVLVDTQITDLSLTQNRITDKGAQNIAQVYPSSSLKVLYLMENNISGSILYQVENYQWQAYCQDQLCHANAQYNGYTATLNSSDSSRDAPSDHRRNNVLKANPRYSFFDQDITLTHSTDFNSTDPLSNRTLRALPRPTSGESTKSLLTFAGSGGMMVGMLLLYKNVTFVRAVVDAGCRLLQRCFYRTRDSLTTASHFYLFPSSLKTVTRTAQQTDSHSTIIFSDH